MHWANRRDQFSGVNTRYGRVPLGKEHHVIEGWCTAGHVVTTELWQHKRQELITTMNWPRPPLITQGDCQWQGSVQISHPSLVLQYLFRREHLEGIDRNEQLIANLTFAVADHFRRAQVYFNHRLCSEKDDEQVRISRCCLFLDLEPRHDALFQIHQSRASDLSF
jgi:hypothetical protein